MDAAFSTIVDKTTIRIRDVGSVRERRRRSIPVSPRKGSGISRPKLDKRDKTIMRGGGDKSIPVARRINGGEGWWNKDVVHGCN